MKTIRATKRSRLSEGSSIVEAVSSLFILGMFISGAAEYSLSCKQLSDSARSHYQAVNIAKNRLERTKVMDFDHLEYFTEDRVRVNMSGVPDDRGHFRRSTTITATGSDLKEIHVLVNIQNRRTLQFDQSKEEIRSWLANYQAPAQ
ncbi:MAG: hypothetical protein O2923_02405 [Verrucomicrobia bacterium]|nr:hypothetical protein [Verrucomicrobiota bacterium]MDA1086168.1 hypothetical protein [Verrucomicrobiota bacterium]